MISLRQRAERTAPAARPAWTTQPFQQPGRERATRPERARARTASAKRGRSGGEALGDPEAAVPGAEADADLAPALVEDVVAVAGGVHELLVQEQRDVVARVGAEGDVLALRAGVGEVRVVLEGPLGGHVAGPVPGGAGQ